MSTNRSYEEKELLSALARGDQRSFAILVESYASQVYAHVLRYVKDAFRAEEITQDIFLKIWESRAELPEKENAAGFLYVLTRNYTISALRKKLDTAYAEYNEGLPADDITPVEQLELKEFSGLLEEAVEQLPPRRRQVFRMSRYEGMTYEQIALQLGISKGTVNEHIVEALIFLRTHLKKQSGKALVVSILLHTILRS